MFCVTKDHYNTSVSFTNEKLNDVYISDSFSRSLSQLSVLFIFLRTLKGKITFSTENFIWMNFLCFLPCVSGISTLYVVEKGIFIHISTQYLGIFWRLLHVPHAFRDLEKLTQLLELNVSSNMLTYLPSCLGRHPHLQVLRASCNLLQELPSFKNSSALKVVNITFTYNKLH